jgi:hypothetical protein
MTVNRLLAATLCSIAACSSPSHAEGLLSEQVPIVGGTAALARTLRLETVPDRATFLTELTRVIYNTPEGRSAATDALLQGLAKHLEVVDRFQKALAAVQPEHGSIALAMAAQKNDRNRLKDFLDLVGLKLREKNKTFSVERADNKPAAERVRLLADLGVNLDQLAATLNRGEAVRVELPTETVPIPLTAALWSKIIFQRTVPVTTIFSSIIGDRRAALLCHGLAAIDDETLQFLVDRPQLLARLYEHDSGAFAAFAGALEVRGGQLVVPGGASAAPLWEALVDEKFARPDRFVRELFSKHGGRVAYLYDGISHLDDARARFALGVTIGDLSTRVERFRALAGTVTSNDQLDFDARPFSRPAADTVLLLARVHALPTGAPAAPAWQKFWSRAFDSIDLPENAAKQLKNFQENGVVDAAWFAEALRGTDFQFRRERLDQMDFGHRVFGRADASALPDALVAVRAFPRYRMLMLSLERMGVTTPAVYVTAARQANRLSGLDADRGFIALSQFQGGLALIARMALVHTIDAARAEALVSSLSAAMLSEDGRFNGAIARWLNDQLAPTFGKTGNLDEALVGAIAGPAPIDPPQVVTWEDRRYRVDLATAEANRLTAMREKIGAPAVDTPASLVRVTDALSTPGLAFESLQPLIAELKKIEAALVPPPKRKKQAPAVLPAGVSPRKSAYDIVASTVQNLSNITKPKDVKKAAREAAPLLEAVDTLLADALLSLDYALDLGDPEGDGVLAGNISRRHDFGFAQLGGEYRARGAWRIPAQVSEVGVPWHVKGAAVGLDIALSPLALRRVRTNQVATSTLTDVQRATFTETVVLMNPFDLLDVDIDGIAAAIDRGRAAVNAIDGAGTSLDAIADSLHMDGWRRRAITWTATNDREATLSFFSLRELLQLGDPSGHIALDHIGNAAVAFDGCLCTELMPSGAWMAARGRTYAGLLAVYAADLNLRVLLALHELHLPAALARDVLAAAMQDYVDEVRPIEADDWLSLIRAAQKIPRERIEDYVATLTVRGPLVPESGSFHPHP